MKNILYSILLCLVVLALGCDDAEKELPFEVSTDTWTFPKEGKTGSLIVSAPGAWEVSSHPDWCTLVPDRASGPREVKMECSENAGAERTGTVVLICGAESCMIHVSQEGTAAEE